MQTTLISQGIDLMLFGMGTVFVFLILLVVITAVMSKCIMYFAPEPELLVEETAAIHPAVDLMVIKAVQMALDQHRGRRS